jgi:hypothetical protein
MNYFWGYVAGNGIWWLMGGFGYASKMIRMNNGVQWVKQRLLREITGQRRNRLFIARELLLLPADKPPKTPVKSEGET